MEHFGMKEKPLEHETPIKKPNELEPPLIQMNSSNTIVRESNDKKNVITTNTSSAFLPATERSGNTAVKVPQKYNRSDIPQESCAYISAFDLLAGN
jgi:hypothetical protein